jgi:hypothetical protein
MDSQLIVQDQGEARGGAAAEGVTPTDALLRRAAIRATRAPSVHNTQPWRLTIRGSAVEVRADPDRRLPTFDPLGRQMMMSCGTAVFNARVALAAAGRLALVRRLPDRNQPTLLAQVEMALPDFVADPDLAALDSLVRLRRTNRGPFLDRPVPESVLAELVAAARAEGADLVVAGTQANRDALRKLTVAATAQRLMVPRYRAELRAWTAETNDRVGGVGPSSLAEPPAADPWGPEVDPVLAPVLAPERWGPEACLVLTTMGDHPQDWIQAGEALERVLLEATKHRLVVSLESSAIEVLETRTGIHCELDLDWHPQLVLRAGYAIPAPPTPRRPFADVFTDEK